MNTDTLELPIFVKLQLKECMDTFDISNPLRMAHFLAQCHHESDGFKQVVENFNYSEEGLRKTFGKYFPGNLAREYAKHPAMIASRVYANRMGNLDEASKHGWLYRGRGYIQLTGKDNYAAFDKIMPEDILQNPEFVATRYPLLSAAWFWNSRKLNDLADRGAEDAQVEAITRKVNGGTNGLKERIALFDWYYAGF